MPAGALHQMEMTRLKDPHTGQRIFALTDGGGHDQLLYFTSSSLTSDDQFIVFISDRDGGHPNLFCLDRRKRQAVQLTENAAGHLQSYVYFDGNRQGFGKASVSLHPASGDVYYVQGRRDGVSEVRRVNCRTLESAVLAELPPDHLTAFTHASDDNSLLCVPTIHESAFRETPRRIPDLVEEDGLKSAVRLVETGGGGARVAWEEPGWVTHVQFQPGRNDVILFNHEWRKDSGIRRMWLWDGARVLRLRPEGRNADGSVRQAHDWTCHEMWERDGMHVIYHGTRASVPYLGRVNADGTGHIELSFPEGWTRYGHFTVSNDPTLLVADGYVESDLAPRSAHRQGQWISLIRADWTQGHLSWRPLCEHGSSWASQDEHPHPIFSHASREVLYTSDARGRRAIFAVPLE